ncbi:MAG: hypothetical protein RLZZ81_802 [Pseudomonadota bacterium]|jgi:hypothetical protein
MLEKDKGSKILKEFPKEYLDKTIRKILEQAKKGDKPAQKARKLLLDQSEFKIVKRSKVINKLLSTINKIFGNDSFIISSRWDSVCDVGLQRGNKLIYISTFGCKKNCYFYECEILVNDPEEVYIVEDSDTALEEELLEIISKFFEIKVIN